MSSRKLFLSACLSIGLAGCAQMMSRSSSSGYAVTHTSDNSNLHRTENISEKTRLKQLENSIPTRKEVEQYSKALPYFRSDSERIQFLELPDFEARQRWLSEQSFSSRAGSVQSEMKELVEAQDIAIGMPQSLVRQSWGEPESIEVSGNPQFKNERWRYHKYVSTQDGYKPEKKVVYFEGGKVVGWEVE